MNEPNIIGKTSSSLSIQLWRRRFCIWSLLLAHDQVRRNDGLSFGMVLLQKRLLYSKGEFSCVSARVMEASPSFHGVDGFSAASTIITFDQPLPLLRGPLRAGFHEDSSRGPYVLAFRDFRAWQSGFKACRSKIVRQCEEGARFGCAVSASNKCRSPWWWALIGRKRGFDSTERGRCEELEMAACLAAAKERCVGFADEKCLKPFRDARIAMNERRMMEKKARKWVHWASMSNFGFFPNMIELDRNSSQNAIGSSHFRAAELWTSDKGLENLLSDGIAIKDSIFSANTSS